MNQKEIIAGLAFGIGSLLWHVLRDALSLVFFLYFFHSIEEPRRLLAATFASILWLILMTLRKISDARSK